MYQDQISLADFVQQEAREKCFEIEVKAFKQFEREKKVIVDKEIVNIQEEFQNKLKKKEQEGKIKHSAVVNRCRLEKMQTRNRALMKVYSDVQYQLFKMVRQDKGFYKILLGKLIVQGLIKLFEKDVKIRCLEKDVPLVQEVLGQAKKEFQDILRKELDLEFDCQVTVDEDKHLEERILNDNAEKNVADYTEEEGKTDVIHKTEDDKKCFGGVILTTHDGLIICKNTLDVRTDLCFQDSLPDIRAQLFPLPVKQ